MGYLDLGINAVPWYHSNQKKIPIFCDCTYNLLKKGMDVIVRIQYLQNTSYTTHNHGDVGKVEHT